MSGTQAPDRVRFGAFAFDAASGDLWKKGIRSPLHGKPLEILLALLERPGSVVSRQKLRERLWPADTHVEFENGLNNAISRLREALGDTADNPRFVETVPRRGYRFIAPVEIPGALSAAEPAPRERNWRNATTLALAILPLVGVAGWLWTKDAGSPVRRVAVLPFVTSPAGGNSQEDYIAFGMTDAIIAELSRAGGLDVISQTSSVRYRGTTKSLPEIARELGAAAVIEGSIVREGDQVRITVQLIDPGRDAHLWTDTFRRDAGSVMVTQAELAREVARSIRLELTGEPAPAAEAARTVDPRVREAHLKGRYFMSLGTEEGRSRALTFFEEALTIDPDHAPTHSGVADYYILTDSMSTAAAIPRARAAAERAIKLDPTLVDAHVSLGFLHYYGGWDWPSAERAFVTALDLDPNHARGRRWYGQFLAAMGRGAEAAQHVRRALELDPVSLATHGSAAQVWLHTRDVDRLLEQGHRILELNPGAPLGYEHVGSAHLLKGDHAQALEQFERGLELSKRDVLFLAFLAVTRGAAGETSAARVALDELNTVAGKTFVPPFLLAMGHLGTGDREGALQWLERGYEERDAYLVFVNASPWMDPLRSDARFEALVRRLRFP
jgi:TolB-like protein/DNA-binding winged helix-turn-helix (wHTH) protein/tetratricopeptide (TPR) repeat protein